MEGKWRISIFMRRQTNGFYSGTHKQRFLLTIVKFVILVNPKLSIKTPWVLLCTKYMQYVSLASTWNNGKLKNFRKIPENENSGCYFYINMLKGIYRIKNENNFWIHYFTFWIFFYVVDDNKTTDQYQDTEQMFCDKDVNWYP